MDFNKSQLLIIGTIVTGMLGIPNITKVFTDAIIPIVMENPTRTIMILISFLKIFSVVVAFAWAFQLYKNVILMYNTHSSNQFLFYIVVLVCTAIITAAVMYSIIR